VLIQLWKAFDYPCSQRLVAVLREQVPRLRSRGLLHCQDAVAGKLLTISAKTIDRKLAGERRRLQLSRYRRAATQRLLLETIPVKLPDAWDRTQIGNLQLDYVFHCGQSAAGVFLRTFSAVDIASGWWEGRPVLDGSQQAACSALDGVRRRLPFRLREIHPDNDSAFLNALMVQYCADNGIALSRSRPLKKNDNCWVEQKNWTHVRKLVGYHRLAGHQQHVLLCRLYEAWADWRNFFQPVMRLEHKVRSQGKVHRRYDQPRTPYQRLLESGQLSTAATEKLKRRYESLNPFTLLRAIQSLVQQMHRTLRSDTKRKIQPRAAVTRLVTQQVRAR
jgi:hypothetical protein